MGGGSVGQRSTNETDGVYSYVSISLFYAVFAKKCICHVGRTYINQPWATSVTASGLQDAYLSVTCMSSTIRNTHTCTFVGASSRSG